MEIARRHPPCRDCRRALPHAPPAPERAFGPVKNRGAWREPPRQRCGAEDVDGETLALKAWRKSKPERGQFTSPCIARECGVTVVPVQAAESLRRVRPDDWFDRIRSSRPPREKNDGANATKWILHGKKSAACRPPDLAAQTDRTFSFHVTPFPLPRRQMVFPHPFPSEPLIVWNGFSFHSRAMEFVLEVLPQPTSQLNSILLPSAEQLCIKGLPRQSGPRYNTPDRSPAALSTTLPNRLRRRPKVSEHRIAPKF